MDEQKNLHAGHRERTIENFVKNSDVFSDHQVLEVLLFYAIPRVDTNPLAHKLINIFGNLHGVFNASTEQLMNVNGVGKKVASYIQAIGQLYKRMENQKEEKLVFSNPLVTKEFCVKFFNGLLCEKFIILLLDKNFKLLTRIEFDDNNQSKVSAELPEVISAINAIKPTYAIIAHNHTSGICYPSEKDDFTTKKLNLLCELHEVNLIDHIIVAKNKVFSYKDENLMDKIKTENSLYDILTK